MAVLRYSDFSGFRAIFGQTWPQNPSRTTGLVLQCRLDQKSAPQINSKAMSWQFGIRKSPPRDNCGCVLHHFSSPTRWNGSRGQVRPETSQKPNTNYNFPPTANAIGGSRWFFYLVHWLAPRPGPCCQSCPPSRPPSRPPLVLPLVLRLSSRLSSR